MVATAVVDNPEIVIGLVGPIGVDLNAIIGFLNDALHKVQYRTELIHITQVMEDVLPQVTVDKSSYGNRYRSLIKQADLVRKGVKNHAALACLAVSEIRRLRAKINEVGPDQPALGTAYIVRQLKREEEITLLREVYGRKFIQVSVFSDKDERRRQLIKKIKGHGTGIVEEDDAEKEAIDLIAQDHNEVDEAYGQRVSDVFHLGDVFVPGEDGKQAADTIDRFIRAFFGHNSISPTKDEYGMYAAAGASLRSLDLSRQIGAAIFSDKGEVVTLGCNEVPKAFGGTYWCDDPEAPPHRDFEEGEDGNHSRKLRLLHDLIERMGTLGYLSKDLMEEGQTGDQVKKLVSERLISDSRMMDIIEFGRIIHAEMSAITDAARKGKALAETIMFTTTFPCHMCAKHVVSSGIRRVVFLEPYPKSHAKDMHADSITFSPAERDTKVLFEPFIGISPRRYRDIFEKKKRKDSDGKAVPWAQGTPAPRIEDKSPAYIANEEPAIAIVVDNILSLDEHFQLKAEDAQSLPR
ncbi:deoxycytidylate deaminase [Rhizobium anhuiense]|uniref:anti-phage dCTP deaminase n=1 Tax=Rhizobium anhuiense TaxID=1184720 RepID=UPI000BE8F171|nr:anti-phage dCTP deaminase [Rhizobium anhuiense]PDS43173.1 deoxycytidylate deaminase [Rhizobium anhuiense]